MILGIFLMVVFTVAGVLLRIIEPLGIIGIVSQSLFIASASLLIIVSSPLSTKLENIGQSLSNPIKELGADEEIARILSGVWGGPRVFSWIIRILSLVWIGFSIWQIILLTRG